MTTKPCTERMERGDTKGCTNCILWNLGVKEPPFKLHRHGALDRYNIALTSIIPSANTGVTLAARIRMVPVLLVLLDVRLAKLRKLFMGKCSNHGIEPLHCAFQVLHQV